MTVKEPVEKLGLEVMVAGAHGSGEISGVYVGDLHQKNVHGQG